MPMTCPQCGQVNIDTARFCESCGGRMESAAAPSPPATPSTGSGPAIDPYATAMWSNPPTGSESPTPAAPAPPAPPAPAPENLGMSHNLGMTSPPPAAPQPPPPPAPPMASADPPSPMGNFDFGEEEPAAPIPPPTMSAPLPPPPTMSAPPPPPPTMSAPPPVAAAPQNFSAPPPPQQQTPPMGTPSFSAPPPPAAPQSFSAPPPAPPPPAGGAPSFSAPPPAAPPPGGFQSPPPPPPSFGGSVSREPHPRPANLGWIGEAWAMLSSDFGGWLMLFVPFLAIYIGVMVVSMLTGGLLSILGLVMGPVMVGTLGALLKKMRTGQSSDFGGVIAMSKEALVPGIVFSLIAGIAVGCGMMLCLVPGLFLIVPMYLGFFQIADGETDFIKPLTRNIEVAKSDIGGYLIFGLVCVLIGGFVITLPLVMMAMALAYRANYE